MLTIKSASETNYVAAIARNDGLFSNVMTVIGMLHDAEVHGVVPVVKFDAGLYLDPAAGPNWWEYYFEPVSDLPASETNVDHLQASMMVPLASAPWKLGLPHASELVARYILPRQEILDEVERFFEEHLSGYYVVGVHMRGTDKYEETAIRLPDSVVLQAVGELTRQLRVPYKIFAASDETHYIELLRRAYGERVVSYDAVRSQSSDLALHRSGRFPRWQIGRDAVVECWLLSKADYLFGSHSNLSMMARCLHPEMHHVCFNDVSDRLNSYPIRMRHMPPIRFPGRRGEDPSLSDRYRFAPAKRVYSVSVLARCARRRGCGDREHIVILPYYSQREIETFRRLAELWRGLPTGQARYRFLVSARFDAPRPPSEWLRALSNLAPVEFFRCSTVERCFPDSASAMFFDTMEHVFHSAAPDGGFALWFEPDMVPLRSGWLEDLDREWRAGHFTVMGKLVDLLWVPRHINGGACYAKDFVRVVPRTRDAWDVTAFPFVRDFGYFKATELFEFRYQNSTLGTPPRRNAAIIHGVKDLSAIEFVAKRIGGPLFQ
jgi:hypothetical protein